MLKHVKRYVREQFERKIIPKSDKVDTTRKAKHVCYCKYNPSVFPDYLKKVNQTFNLQYTALKHSHEQQDKDSSTRFKNTKCVDSRWIETFGLSGTFAFGWSLSQNIELKRKHLVDEILSLHYSKNYPLQRALCPYTAFKNVLPKHVETQPNEFLQSKLDSNLPVFGPLTAEETLNEAKRGLEKTRNAAIAELENRMGLRCLSKHRYRRAMIHFAAGSALQNSSASYHLAQCYELGLGTPKDSTKAVKYYQVSSQLGNATATFNLAVYYARGLGGLKCDTRKARELLEKAVELGDAHAKVVLENRIKQKQSTVRVTKQAPLSSTHTLVEPVVNEKPMHFSKINADNVTETNITKKMPGTTEKCEAVAVQKKSDKDLPDISLLEMKERSESVSKLPISFDNPPRPRKEFICGIPLIIPTCANKVNAVQGQ